MAIFNVTVGDDFVSPDGNFSSSLLFNQSILIDGALITEPNPIPASLLLGDDEIFALTGNDNINAGEGNDRIEGGFGNDFLQGAAGDDTLNGGFGSNSLDGGDDFDLVSYENNLNVTVDLSLGTGDSDFGGRVDTLFNIEGIIGSTFSFNTLTGNNDNNLLRGGSFGDVLNGGGGNDTLEAGEGNNDLNGGTGSDLLIAGAGNDTYTIDNVAFAGGTQIEDGGGLDTLNFIQPLSVVAASPTVGTVGMGRSGENLLIDISQDGVINPADDLTIFNFYVNTTDNVAGIGFIESVAGIPGNTILGLGHIIPTVEVTTPTANNTTPGLPVLGIVPFAPLDLPNGEQLYLLTNEVDFEPVPAEAAGRQVLALSGNDNITGSSDSDDIVGNKGADTVSGGLGFDTLRGGRGSDQLNGGDDDDILNGNEDHDTLNGGFGDDIIRGGKGEDVLFGDEGNDFLIGDRNQDILTGGTGEDTFVLLPGPVKLNQADIITDFVAGTDKIMLTDGLTFADLSLTQIQLQVDGGAAIMSITIQSPDNSYLGIVQNVLSLNVTDFVPEDLGVTTVG